MIEIIRAVRTIIPAPELTFLSLHMYLYLKVLTTATCVHWSCICKACSNTPAVLPLFCTAKFSKSECNFNIYGLTMYKRLILISKYSIFSNIKSIHCLPTSVQITDILSSKKMSITSTGHFYISKYVCSSHALPAPDIFLLVLYFFSLFVFSPRSVLHPCPQKTAHLDLIQRNRLINTIFLSLINIHKF